MTTANPRYAVIIPCKNARHTIVPCLEAILTAAEKVGGVPVTVVDNGSTDGSQELIAERFGSAVTLLVRPNATVGALRNSGAAASPGAVLCFIDADCVITSDWFLRVQDALGRSGAAAVGCYYALPAHPGAMERAWDRLHFPSRDGPVSMINSGNLAVRREAFDAVGGFDEVLPTGEDAELCQRLMRRGQLLWQDRSLVARHLGNPGSLPDFFRKQRWHALGAFGTVRTGSLDRPFLMTLLFVVTSLVGLWLLVSPGLLASRRLLGCFLLLLAPLATVVYRGIAVRRFPPVVRGVVLYWLYYLARAAALPAAFRYRRSSLAPLS